MFLAPENNRRLIYWRILRWFISVFLAVFLFTLLFMFLPAIRISARSFGEQAQFFGLVFRFTLIFALPVACLFLPMALACKDAKHRRFWILLISGAFVGPVTLALWFLVLVLFGQNAHELWYGDPLAGIGGFDCIVFAFVVGTLATVAYILFLRLERSQFAD
jgi:NADH:ubiquinone oxidoreductase subunit 6 (subunit J)